MDADKLAVARARRERGESPTQIAKALGVSRASVCTGPWRPIAEPLGSPAVKTRQVASLMYRCCWLAGRGVGLG